MFKDIIKHFLKDEMVPLEEFNDLKEELEDLREMVLIKDYSFWGHAWLRRIPLEKKIDLLAKHLGATFEVKTGYEEAIMKIKKKSKKKGSK
jgi:hypothetical protein